jgi:putative transposase
MNITISTHDGLGSQSAVRLRAGEVVLIDGRRFIVGTAVGNFRTFTDASDPGLQVSHSQSAISHMAREKRLLIEARCHDLPHHMKEALTRALESYKDTELAYMDSALRYCKAFDSFGPRLRLTSKFLTPIIKETARKIGDESPLAWNQFRILYQRWITAGRDPRSLLPGWNSRGNRIPRKPHWIYEFTTNFLISNWLVETRPTIPWLKPKFLKAIETRAAELGVATPTFGKNFLYRKASDFERYTKLYHRHSKREADAVIRNVGRGPEGSYAGEVYEMDHTPLDILVRDLESSTMLSRPFLTVVLDRFARFAIGFCISFHPPSWVTVMLALKMALGRRELWLSRFKDIETDYQSITGPWPDAGAPLGFVWDGGKEFQSSSADAALLRIGAHSVDLPHRSPELKGKVEAYLDTIQKATIHNLPGTTFRDIKERGEYQPSKHAILTLPAVEWIVSKYLIDVYNKRPHAGLWNERPLDRWNTSVEKWGRRPSVDDQLLTAFLGQSQQRTAERRGIRIEHLWYNSKELAIIRSKCARGGVRTDPDDIATVRIWTTRDLMDLGKVKAICPLTKRWFDLPCTWPEYANGRSQTQHRIIVNQMNAKNKEINEANLIEASNSIHSEIDLIKSGAKRTRQMKYIVRFEDTGPQPHEVIKPSRRDSAASATTISASHSSSRASNADIPVVTPMAPLRRSPDEHPQDELDELKQTNRPESKPRNVIARETRAKAFRSIDDL